MNRKTKLHTSMAVAALAVFAVMIAVAGTAGAAEASPSEKPGISVPHCRNSAIATYWHTERQGRAAAPAGWRVERQHWSTESNNWSTGSWDFIGAPADNLQTFLLPHRRMLPKL